MKLRIQYRIILPLCAALLSVGCNSLHKLSKTDPQGYLHLPAKSQQAYKAESELKDAHKRLIESRIKEVDEKGTLVDSMTSGIYYKDVDEEGNQIAIGNIETVTVTVSSRRNLVERGGKILVDFIVAAPEELMHKNWQLVLNPILRKGVGGNEEQLDPVVLTGANFRRMQEQEYEAYNLARGGLVGELRQYVLSTDRVMGKRVSYMPNTANKFDHIDDYLAPRYRFKDIDVLPGGEYYTRIRGQYPEGKGREREAWMQSLVKNGSDVKRRVNTADESAVREMPGEPLLYTNLQRPSIEKQLFETDPETRESNLTRSRYYFIPGEDDGPSEDSEEDLYHRHIQHPYYPNARLDTLVHDKSVFRPDSILRENPDTVIHMRRIKYHYVQEIQADENTDRLFLYLRGGVDNGMGGHYTLRRSDTLTFAVHSMMNYLDTTTRYRKVILKRDKEDNRRFYFTFAAGKAVLDTTADNRSQIRAIRNLTRDLMLDPIFIIDSISLRATASPEGTWSVNDRLARERAEALRKVLVQEFRPLHDSLQREQIRSVVTLDDQGRQVVMNNQSKNQLPDLPNLLRAKWQAEDWDELYRLASKDPQLSGNQPLLAMIADKELNPDTREYKIRSHFPKEYAHMRQNIYPQMRAVDFKFNLHRRGQQEEVVTTDEVDTDYMRALDLMKRRKYEEALEILRSYDDHNTAIAYMSLGYDQAAYRVFSSQQGVENDAEEQYMMALLCARMANDQQAVTHFKRAVELRPAMRFRANLDPEMAILIEKYRLNEDDAIDAYL